MDAEVKAHQQKMLDERRNHLNQMERERVAQEIELKQEKEEHKKQVENLRNKIEETKKTWESEKEQIIERNTPSN